MLRRGTAPALALAAAVICAPAAARAGGASWRLSEVLPRGDGGDPAIRFVELYATADGCWFPTTQVAVYDGAGAVLDTAAPFAETTCFDADAYLLLATAEAGAAFGVTPDRAVVPAMPASARQVCLRSTTTIYDCVRWGAVSAPVHDLFGPDDDTAAAAPPPGVSAARVVETHVVAVDWELQAPTPRALNDGEPHVPPDGGVPDAGAPDDGGVVDAGPAPDGWPDAARPDAGDDRYLDLDAGGGAGCGCRAGGGAAGAAAGWALLAAAAVTACRRRRACRRTAAPPG